MSWWRESAIALALLWAVVLCAVSTVTRMAWTFDVGDSWFFSAITISIPPNCVSTWYTPRPMLSLLVVHVSMPLVMALGAAAWSLKPWKERRRAVTWLSAIAIFGVLLITSHLAIASLTQPHYRYWLYPYPNQCESGRTYILSL